MFHHSMIEMLLYNISVDSFIVATTNISNITISATKVLPTTTMTQLFSHLSSLLFATGTLRQGCFMAFYALSINLYWCTPRKRLWCSVSKKPDFFKEEHWENVTHETHHLVKVDDYILQ